MQRAPQGALWQLGKQTMHMASGHSNLREDSLPGLPVGKDQSLNNRNPVARASAQNTFERSFCAAGSALESKEVCTATQDFVVNADPNNLTLTGLGSLLTTVSTGAGYVVSALVATLEQIMHTASSNLFNKAISILGAMERTGVMFKVVMPDGTHFGNLPYQAKEKNATRRKRGTFSEYIDPYLSVLDVGDSTLIQLPEWMENMNDFQSRVCARAHTYFGSCGYTTQTVENIIEVMRLK